MAQAIKYVVDAKQAGIWIYQLIPVWPSAQIPLKQSQLTTLTAL